jgi:excisionase family DNA binding protein
MIDSKPSRCGERQPRLETEDSGDDRPLDAEPFAHADKDTGGDAAPTRSRRTIKAAERPEATRRTRGTRPSMPPSSRALPPAVLTGRDLQEPLLTIGELAERIGVHDKTIRRWIQSGRLVARKLGGQWRIHPSDYRAFLHAGVTD